MADNSTNLIFYSDLPLTGQTNVNGKMKILYNSDALSQAIQIWLVSATGEKLRTTGGGWLDSFLAKPLTDENAELIRKNIVTGLTNDFQPTLTIVDLQVVPNQTKGQWLIYVSAFSPQLNIGVSTYANVSAQTTSF